MPTARHSHTLIETPELRMILALAAERWHGAASNGAELLRRVAMDRARRAGADVEARRRAVVPRGALTGVYPAGYLARLRGDWPG